MLLAGVGTGCVISAISKRAQDAWRWVLIFVLLPGLVLSGFVYPLSSMPAAARAASRLFPIGHYLQLARGVLLKGAGWPEVRPQLVSLALFALLLPAAAVLLLRRQRREAA
jgi:ABC-2 type transport system permease protein